MDVDYQSTFAVAISSADVWDALTRRTVTGDDGETHYVLAGFPSFVQLDHAGASCSVVEVEPERFLRVTKDHQPCAGTEITVTLEAGADGTNVTVTQSGFGAFLDVMGGDTIFGHGDQIVRDLHLFIETGITVPGTAWGVGLGAQAKKTPVGVELFAVDGEGFVASAGMQDGDLLLTLRGIRLHDLQQLWTVQALTEPGTSADVTWARGNELMHGKATFAG